MVLIIRDGLQILLPILATLKRIDFNLNLSDRNVEIIYYTSFTDLNKFKVSLLHGEKSEIEKVDFAGG